MSATTSVEDPLVNDGTPESVTKTAIPMPIERKTWIKKFPGGQGKNNCPSFWYLRDGFGCTHSCKYCYLRRFDFRHPKGGELNPDFPTLYKKVSEWLRQPGRQALVLGEVTDGWGWADLDQVYKRNRHLIEMFRAQDRHTLIFLTKSDRVHTYINDLRPTDRVVLAWSLNSFSVAATYEMGEQQAKARLAMAAAARMMGWRVRVRIDPMFPVHDWQYLYRELAEIVASAVCPEMVTLGTWRPRPNDHLLVTKPAMRDFLEQCTDGRLRVSCRKEMYLVAAKPLLTKGIPVTLCKEDLAIHRAFHDATGQPWRGCNCLEAPVEALQ